jgi:hypothetical protein
METTGEIWKLNKGGIGMVVYRVDEGGRVWQLPKRKGEDEGGLGGGGGGPVAPGGSPRGMNLGNKK